MRAKAKNRKGRKRSNRKTVFLFVSVLAILLIVGLFVGVSRRSAKQGSLPKVENPSIDLVQDLNDVGLESEGVLLEKVTMAHIWDSESGKYVSNITYYLRNQNEAYADCRLRLSYETDYASEDKEDVSAGIPPLSEHNQSFIFVLPEGNTDFRITLECSEGQDGE